VIREFIVIVSSNRSYTYRKHTHILNWCQAIITCQHPDCAEADHPSPAWGGTRLCGLHQRGLQADIDDIARVLTLIETHHDELALPSGSGESVRGVPSSRPPMRLGVLDVVTGQTAERITGWAADVVRTSRTLAVPEAARLLARNVDLLCCHIAVDIVAVELRQAAGACRAVLCRQHARSAG
jgi:hypothetical protein